MDNFGKFRVKNGLGCDEVVSSLSLGGIQVVLPKVIAGCNSVCKGYFSEAGVVLRLVI